MTQFSQQQLSLFLDRYALRDESGEVIEKTPVEMWKRVSDTIANNEKEAQEFYDLLSDFKFVPGGRILAGAGAESEKTFYNCYVIPVETKARRYHRTKGEEFYFDPGADSREAIFDTIATMVDIMSRGGGVGINWSVLRPSGGYLTRVSGTSSGPVGWMDVASTAVGEVEQGGSRRGAAMFMLDDWHPDVLKFINAKREKGKITNANISVSVSDEFMESVKSDLIWTFKFPDTTDPKYNTDWDGDIRQWERNGGRVISYRQVPARELWADLTRSAHASGEPGVVFLDRYNSNSTANGAERIICVNPCGEQGLGAYSVCNLGAMNLYGYVTTGYDGDPIFNFSDFQKDVKQAIRFLDNCIDKNFYFLPETKSQQAKLRRIGLGIMGLADCLVALKIRYGSEEAVNFVERVFRTMKDSAIWQSMELAEEHGPALAWDDTMWERPYLAEYAERWEMPIEGKRPLRNLFLLTVAPTGTTSLLADVNSGIEPFFALGYQREDRTGSRWITPRALRNIPEGADCPSYVVTAQQLSVEEHIAMQAGAQKYVDSSVSKTINAPKEQSVAETGRAFTLAYERGCKGIAYYRDGSRSVQVLYHSDPNERIEELETKIKELEGRLALKQQPLGSRIEWYPMGTNSTKAFDNEGMVVINYGSSQTGHPLDCKGEVVFEEGCTKCYSCSWAAC